MPRTRPPNRVHLLDITETGLIAMSDPFDEVIKDNPIGKGLDAFRASFNSVCEDRTPHALGQLDQESMTIQLR